MKPTNDNAFKINDYIAIFKITYRVINGDITDNFNLEIFNLCQDSIETESWLYECILDYVDHQAKYDIELENLQNGLHHFVIGFNIECSYDSYSGGYDTDCYGDILRHTRPKCLNDVREFLIKILYNNNDMDSELIDKRHGKLMSSIERNKKPKRSLKLSL